MDRHLSGKRRHRRLAALGILALSGLGVIGGLGLNGRAAAEASYSIWSDRTQPANAAASDHARVELGVVFSSDHSGSVTGVRFYKVQQAAGPHIGSLWTATGKRLATVHFTDESAAGWQSASFSKPVHISAGVRYVASYTAPLGNYAFTPDYFTRDEHRGGVAGPGTSSGSPQPVRLTATSGVFHYGGGFPDKSWRGTNYFVDVSFTPDDAATAQPSSAASGIPPATTRLRPVDGGTDYYGRFAGSFPTSAAFFPIGVWAESVVEPADTAKDKGAGLNTYVNPTANSDIDLIKHADMHVIGGGRAGVFLTDEADMWGGPGSSAWTGKYPGQGDICEPANSQCGYTVMQALAGKVPAGTLRYANYGKGVTFWESDAQAAKFVNTYQDVVSADNYWFTDENVCGGSEGGALLNGGKALAPAECHKASNYGATIDRERDLVSPAGSKPVWAFVELGHPFTESAWPSITPAQVTAAVWSSIIHGARGIIYFNHSFGGACQTQHALRESCYADIRAAVQKVDQRITELAPVLNAPFADGVASTTSDVDLMAKWYDGHYYLFVGSDSTSPQTATIGVPCIGDATATVLGESRTVPISRGRLNDRFNDSNAVHIYRIDGGSACGR